MSTYYEYCLNIEGVDNKCTLTTDPNIKLFAEKLPYGLITDVYIPEWPLYIKRLNHRDRSYSRYYIQYNTQSGQLRRVTLYKSEQATTDPKVSELIPADNAEYQRVIKMVSHPQFGEYLTQLNLYQEAEKYLIDFNKAFKIELMDNFTAVM